MGRTPWVSGGQQGTGRTARTFGTKDYLGSGDESRPNYLYSGLGICRV
jgi:hypothetical protein